MLNASKTALDLLGPALKQGGASCPALHGVCAEWYNFVEEEVGHWVARTAGLVASDTLMNTGLLPPLSTIQSRPAPGEEAGSASPLPQLASLPGLDAETLSKVSQQLTAVAALGSALPSPGRVQDPTLRSRVTDRVGQNILKAYTTVFEAVVTHASANGYAVDPPVFAHSPTDIATMMGVSLEEH